MTATATATVMPAYRAETLAELLNTEETAETSAHRWRYVAQSTNADSARVAVFDETDTLLGYL